MKKLDVDAASEAARPVILIYTNIRSVREIGGAFDGLQNLKTISTSCCFLVITNEAARTSVL